jgi:hypothetical protein
VTQLQDTAVHLQMARINDLLNQLDSEVSALPLASGEAHAHLQGSLFRFRSAFHGVEPVKEGGAVVLVNGPQRTVEVTK